MFQLMDHYTAVVSLVFLAFFEVVAVCWIFGKMHREFKGSNTLAKPTEHGVDVIFSLYVLKSILVTYCLVVIPTV